MSDQALVTVVVIGVVVAAVAVLALVRARRRRRLQDWYGSEYDHTVESTGSERAADAELLAREKRHETLDIKPLGPGARERYADRWAMVQERFVDDPLAAVAEARELVTHVMSDRGYPIDEGDDQQLADDLSVAHGRTVSEYRTAVEISARAADGEASTEDLRMAMVHYRALFAELLDSSAEDLSAVSSVYPYRDEPAPDRSSAGEPPDRHAAAADREADQDVADESPVDETPAGERSVAEESAAAARRPDETADERMSSADSPDEDTADRARSDDEALGRPRR